MFNRLKTDENQLKSRFEGLFQDKLTPREAAILKALFSLMSENNEAVREALGNAMENVGDSWLGALAYQTTNMVLVSSD